MKNKKVIYSIILIAFLLALYLGMIDHETKSLIHLLTGDLGNLVALALYTLVFTLIGLSFLFIIQVIKSTRTREES